MRKVFVIMAAGLAAAACAPRAQDSLEPLSQGASLSASCSGCHSKAGAGVAMPDLSGWGEAALFKSLSQYKSGKGDSVMHRYARGLTEKDIAEISAYLGAKP